MRLSACLAVCLMFTSRFGSAQAWSVYTGMGRTQTASNVSRPVFASTEGLIAGNDGSGFAFQVGMARSLGATPLHVRLDATYGRAMSLPVIVRSTRGDIRRADRDLTASLLLGLEARAPERRLRPFVHADIGAMRTQLQFLYSGCPECAVEGLDEIVTRRVVRSGLALGVGAGFLARVGRVPLRLDARLVSLTRKERGATLVPITLGVEW